LYLLLRKMWLMTWFSSRLLLCSIGYISILLYRYLMALSLCSCWWQESCGMMWSVTVGFRYILSWIVVVISWLLLCPKLCTFVFYFFYCKLKIWDYHVELSENWKDVG
jgi:hypothetical protein